MDSRDTGLAGKRIDISAVFFLLIAGIMAEAASFISPVFWIMAAVNGFAGTVIALKNKMTFIDWHRSSGAAGSLQAWKQRMRYLLLNGNSFLSVSFITKSSNICCFPAEKMMKCSSRY